MEKVEVSKEFILDLHKEIICPSVKAKIEKEFPQLFETKLEVGKWYKNTKHDYIFCFNGIYDDSSQYGVNRLCCWSVELSSHERHIAFFIPATPEEVKTALVNEAKKRGFKEGVRVKSFLGRNIGTTKNGYGRNEVSDESFEFSSNMLFIGHLCIFKDGKWAEILPQPIKMTVAEVEAKLGHPVEIVK